MYTTWSLHALQVTPLSALDCKYNSHLIHDFDQIGVVCIWRPFNLWHSAVCVITMMMSKLVLCNQTAILRHYI